MAILPVPSKSDSIHGGYKVFPFKGNGLVATFRNQKLELALFIEIPDRRLCLWHASERKIFRSTIVRHGCGPWLTTCSPHKNPMEITSVPRGLARGCYVSSSGLEQFNKTQWRVSADKKQPPTEPNGNHIPPKSLDKGLLFSEY